MYKIYVDTSHRTEKRVELTLEDAEGSKSVETLEGDFDPIVVIDELLKKHNLSPSDISEFVPFLGPGSFTGLKNGVTLCNVLNWALGNKTVSDLKMPNYGGEANIQVPTK